MRTKNGFQAIAANVDRESWAFFGAWAERRKLTRNEALALLVEAVVCGLVDIEPARVVQVKDERRERLAS